MSPEEWAALAMVFILGAMSPGPSLAVILSNTISGGRSQGVATGIGHGIGFGIYAFLVALGLATALSLHDGAQLAFHWGGVAILLWLGTRFIQNSWRGPKTHDILNEEIGSDFTGFIQGFMIALFNPKILAWMLVLYAPFIEPDVSIVTLLGIGALGMVIDGSWYVTVATILSSGDRIERLRSIAHIIDGCMGLLMFVFAGLLASGWF